MLAPWLTIVLPATTVARAIDRPPSLRSPASPAGVPPRDLPGWSTFPYAANADEARAPATPPVQMCSRTCSAAHALAPLAPQAMAVGGR
jgi:hypothetical protein